MSYQYDIQDFYGKRLIFLKETDFWYFNYDTQKTINFKRSAGTQYYCFSHATDRSTGKPVLLLYPLGNNFTDNSVSNSIYPGIYQSTVITFYDPDNLDKADLYAQGVKTTIQKAQDKKDQEEEDKKHWYDPIVTAATTGVIIIGVAYGLNIVLGGLVNAKAKSQRNE